MSASETLYFLDKALAKLGEARVVFHQIDTLLDQASKKVVEARGGEEIPKFNARIKSIFLLKETYLAKLNFVNDAEQQINLIKEILLANDIQE